MFLSLISHKTRVRLDIPISKEAQKIVDGSGQILFEESYASLTSRSNYDPFKVASLKAMRRLLGREIDDNTINHHTFRHTFAITHLTSGMPKEVLQSLLGHASIKTTELYYANWIHKTHLIRWI